MSAFDELTGLVRAIILILARSIHAVHLATHRCL
jgi:hypothetical protein